MPPIDPNAAPDNLDRLATLTNEHLWQIAEGINALSLLLDNPHLLPRPVWSALDRLESSVFDLLEDRGEIPDLLGLDDYDDLDPVWGNWGNTL